jgi:hypothetical protein
LLVERGLITQAQLDQAVAEQRRHTPQRRIGEVLVGLRLITEGEMLRALAEQLGCPLVDLKSEPPDADALSIVPSEFALRHHLLPLHQTDHTLAVAMADPLDIQSIDDLGLLTGLSIRPLLASAADISRAVEQFYMSRMLQDVEAQEQSVAEEESLDVADLQKMAREELVNFHNVG